MMIVSHMLPVIISESWIYGRCSGKYPTEWVLAHRTRLTKMLQKFTATNRTKCSTRCNGKMKMKAW